MTVDLVVKNAIVVTCDEKQTVIRDGGVAVSNGRITQIGESAALEQAAGARTPAALSDQSPKRAVSWTPKKRGSAGMKVGMPKAPPVLPASSR